tara:strand:- start:134 stop:421 length:288 start_codon:yes stop_codon:yes gene_type:complete
MYFLKKKRMRFSKGLATAVSAAAALTIGGLMIPALESPAMARCACEGRSKHADGIHCDTPGGSNSIQKDYCEGCGWTYVNTGKWSAYENYCLTNR